MTRNFTGQNHCHCFAKKVKRRILTIFLEIYIVLLVVLRGYQVGNGWIWSLRCPCVEQIYRDYCLSAFVFRISKMHCLMKIINQFIRNMFCNLNSCVNLHLHCIIMNTNKYNLTWEYSNIYIKRCERCITQWQFS